MRLLKRTYSLAPDAVSRFERVAQPGTRSMIVNDLMRKWAEDQEREALRKQVIEGCEAMSEEYLDMENDFHSIEEEAHLGLES